MKKAETTAVGLTAAALLTAAMTVGGFTSAAAQPDDLSTLLVSPNVITDSLAYTAGAPTFDPNGQPGASTVYTHRDSTRQITNTVLVLPDPQAATAAIAQLQGALSERVIDEKMRPAPVGTAGSVTTGVSPDGSRSISVLFFTEGDAASSIEFNGPAKDSVPFDMVTEYGQKQDTAIKDALSN